jgi:hypothetical protein
LLLTRTTPPKERRRETYKDNLLKRGVKYIKIRKDKKING